MDGVKLPPGAVLAALTQDELVEAAADAVSLSSLEDTPSSARLSSQDRGKKQKNRLRKKITDEAAKSTAELAAIPISSDKSAPEIIERFKRGQRVNLQRHMDRLQIEKQEAVTFVASVMETVGKMRQRNKKLQALERTIQARSVAALENCLFKLATSNVQFQPEPTPGWSWVRGTHNDDEYHAFKRLDDPSIYYGVTISYEKGCVGQEESIFAIAILIVPHAKRARYEMLMWNQRCRLLETLIDRVKEMEVPLARTAIALELESALEAIDASSSARGSAAAPASAPPPPREVSISAVMRQEFLDMQAEMLEACEGVATLEKRGEDYHVHNVTVARCMVRLPTITQQVSSMLRAGKEAKRNGQSVRIEFENDGRFCQLGLSREEAEGQDPSTLKTTEFDLSDF